MKKENIPLIVEKELKFSKGTIWKAITQINQMKQWFFEQIENFEPVVGFKTNFVVKSGDRTFPHIWEITEVITEQKIVYNWRYGGYVGYSFVTFELTPTENGTNIKVITNIIENFIDDIPEFKPESCIAGWEYFLEGLDSYLQNKRDK